MDTPSGWFVVFAILAAFAKVIVDCFRFFVSGISMDLQRADIGVKDETDFELASTHNTKWFGEVYSPGFEVEDQST